MMIIASDLFIWDQLQQSSRSTYHVIHPATRLCLLDRRRKEALTRVSSLSPQPRLSSDSLAEADGDGSPKAVLSLYTQIVNTFGAAVLKPRDMPQ